VLVVNDLLSDIDRSPVVIQGLSTAITARSTPAQYPLGEASRTFLEDSLSVVALGLMAVTVQF